MNEDKKNDISAEAKHDMGRELYKKIVIKVVEKIA